jgi:hypothetical protein
MMAVQAQVSPVITERGNSMIAKTGACFAAGVHQRAYLRDLLFDGQASSPWVTCDLTHETKTAHRRPIPALRTKPGF